MIVLDTHALVWWLDNPAQLSRPASEAIEHAMKTKSVYVSCFSAWEIALALDVRDWLARCERLPFLSFVPVSTAIAVESVRLPDFPHADPADRIITATALSLGAQLVTKDEKLRSYPNVQTVW
jgi:PIN domain nuclease of toxin-antitoxin system